MRTGRTFHNGRKALRGLTCCAVGVVLLLAGGAACAKAQAVPASPPAGDNPNAPPGLYTAVQEQLGLKMEGTKAPDDVIVIDHVEHPSDN